MATIDLYSDVSVENAIDPISPSATGTMTGNVIDTNGKDSVTFVFLSGAQTTTSVTAVPIINEGSVTGTLTAVADANLIGTEADANLSGTAGAAGATKIGYKGNLRYVRGDLLVASAATGVYSAACILGSSRKKPAS